VKGKGIDPAPSESHKSDDGAIVLGLAEPRLVGPEDRLPDNPADWTFYFVYARRLTWVERASARQWSGILHSLHQRFRFERLVMDPNQGGTLIKRELILPRQTINGVETDVTPIGDQVDAPRLVARGDFILHLFKRGDPGIESLWPELPGDDNLNDALYSTCKEALDHGQWGWPALYETWKDERREELALWSEERVTALQELHRAAGQLQSIVVLTREDGTILFTKRNARQFSALGKKDLALASMYCYCAFLICLRSEDWRTARSAEDEKGFFGW
jgi:hypothetical protein